MALNVRAYSMKSPGRPCRHVVFNIRIGSLECLNCLSAYVFPMPAPVGLLVAASKSFLRDHQHCPWKEGKSRSPDEARGAT